MLRAVSITLLVCLTSVGCGGTDDLYTIVTVTNRPAVHDVDKLRVTLSNTGTMRTDDIDVGDATFPATFSLTAPGREGELGITVDALDASGLSVGHGTVMTTIDAPTATVLLDSTDFVINTEFADDQYPSDDFEAHGFQLASAADGTWTVAYRDACNGPTGCNMFARRFDASGRPVSTQIAAGTNGFPVTTNLTTFASTPAIATAGNTTVVVWDFDEPASTAVGVACRSFDQMGRAIPDQLTVATDPSTDVVSIVPLANNGFAVSWNAFITTSVIRSAIVRPDCTLVTAPTTVSTTANARRVSAAATGMPSTLMYAFVVAGGVRIRLANASNAFIAPTAANDIEILPAKATEVVEHVRVAPITGGFAMFVRWAQATGTSGPGRIDMYRTNLAGALMGAPVLISSRSGTDFQSSEAFGVTSRADGTLFVTWHACLENGDGSDCGVFGRAVRADGTPVGAELSIATTTSGPQSDPSVAPLPDGFAVVWKDESMQAPDVSGSAVRGRIVYP
jgi:hypothetical protein